MQAPREGGREGAQALKLTERGKSKFMVPYCVYRAANTSNKESTRPISGRSLFCKISTQARIDFANLRASSSLPRKYIPAAHQDAVFRSAEGEEEEDGNWVVKAAGRGAQDLPLSAAAAKRRTR